MVLVAMQHKRVGAVYLWVVPAPRWQKAGRGDMLILLL